MATRSEVLQLLKDYRPFHANFGGAMPLDETGVVDASYGPGGVLKTGAGFKKGDVPGLILSYRKLNAALRFLRRDHFQEWGALIEPYLSDVADSGVVEHWRRKLAELDAENERRRESNRQRVRLIKKGKGADAPVYQHEKTGLVFMRVQLERHDRAIARLSEYLEDANLHVVFPKLMSTREEQAGEAANAQIYAYFHQVRVAGRTHRGAVAASAWKFGISEDEVERIIEFREDVKLATCAMPDCDNQVFSQNLCQKHYQQEWRAKKKNVS